MMSDDSQRITEETHPHNAFYCLSCECELSQSELQAQVKHEGWSLGFFCTHCQLLIFKIQSHYSQNTMGAGAMLRNHHDGYKSPHWGDELQAMIDDHKRIFPQWTYVVKDRERIQDEP